MRTIAQIPASAAIHNLTAQPVVIGSRVSVNVAPGGTATFTKANYSLIGASAPALEPVQEIWQGIANLVQRGVLEFTDATTLDPADTIDADPTAVDTVPGIRPGMPGYYANPAAPKMSGSFAPATNKFTVAFTEPVSNASLAALTTAAFAVAFAANGGAATAAAVSAVTAVGGGALAAGARAAEVTISVTGTPTGEETVTLTAPGAKDLGDVNGQNRQAAYGSIIGTLAAG